MHDDSYQMYLEELGAIEPCTRKEEEELFKRLRQGDTQARTRLLEANLGFIVELARERKNRGLPLGDLIQEANLALLAAVDRYEEGDFRALVRTMVKDALDAALEEQKNHERASEELLARVNVLKDISAQMAEELGREATVEELAKKMKMTADEIRDIMKLTLDAL